MLNDYFKHETSMCNDSTNVLGECSSAKRSKTSDPQQSQPYAPLVNWSHLPDIIIQEIFDNLNFTDRTNASSVCKHWRRNVYHWRWWKILFSQLIHILLKRQGISSQLLPKLYLMPP
ncbi:hypothetical protein HHI36_003413 [Cryptolaemus montrouzieri]|uniref:F-box domain-containing protein n=1 Tax=Cryptolaemus montrouzieri TaxID=559131 RepID=A0ABD2PE37_9CUCU